MSERLEIVAVRGLPEISEGDPLGVLIARALAAADLALADDDVVCVSQKVVSKAEGRVRRLGQVEPGAEATRLAEELGKDPRLVELVLSESARVVRAERGVLITETSQGWVCANAGIDSSNVPGSDAVALLPLDADESARRLRAELGEAGGARPAVVVSDSFGRPWRHGQTEVAIGCAGLAPLDDWRGRTDATGRELAATEIAMADELAAAADLARDKASGIPVVVIRGAGRHRTDADGPGAAALRRGAADDLFR
jgi:coenzyme F420-0:L-glutamate ligase/coenzyme F420-1:gamma-L-glutamate ligase